MNMNISVPIAHLLSAQRLRKIPPKSNSLLSRERIKNVLTRPLEKDNQGIDFLRKTNTISSHLNKITHHKDMKGDDSDLFEGETRGETIIRKRR